MMARVHQRRRRSGASAVEFALVAPILVMLTFGMLDWGWYFATAQEVALAARVGARIGAQTPIEEGPAASAKTAAEAQLARGTLSKKISATVTTELVSFDRVVVTVEANTPPLLGLLPTPSTHSVVSVHFLEDE